MNINFIKNNKNIIIAVALFFVLLIFAMKVKDIIMPDSGVASYGNRLDDKVEITKNIEKKIAQSINNEAQVKVREAGNIINITIKINNDTKRDTGKGYANKALESFSNKEKEYYDFQFYITKDDKENKSYPVIGYKNQTSNKIVWTKDR